MTRVRASLLLFWVSISITSPNSQSVPIDKYFIPSLVLRPCLAFHHLQCGKAWRACYLFSCEHDVIGKFLEQAGCVLRIVQLTTRSTLSAYDNRPPLDACGKLLAMLALFAVLDPMHPHTIKPFLPSFLS